MGSCKNNENFKRINFFLLLICFIMDGRFFFFISVSFGEMLGWLLSEQELSYFWFGPGTPINPFSFSDCSLNSKICFFDSTNQIKIKDKWNEIKEKNQF